MDTNDQDLLPDCGRVRAELGAYLYDELAFEARTNVEQHLAGCASCADELAALRDTRSLLAKWETPSTNEDPRALARAIAAGARVEAPRAVPRGRLVRWAAMASGAAAAVLFVLSLLQAHASVADGRFELSFGLPGTSSATPAQRLSSDQVRAIAAQEVALRAANLEQNQAELFQRCTQMNQQELLRLSQAVDYALAQTQRSMDTRLVSLGREAQRADRETYQALHEVAAPITASIQPISQPNSR